MTGFDLSGQIEAESGNNEATMTTEDDEAVTRFEANEVGDGYILGAEWASTMETATVDTFGFDRPSVSWGDDLSDYPEKVENNDYNDQQKLQLLAMLFKSTLGAMQSEKNEGYGAGWDTDKSPPKPYDNDNTHYADTFRHLPAWEWEGLDDGEKEAFEEEGQEVSKMGFDRQFDGPKLPVINGERVPIVVEEGDELQKALKLINQIDFENLTYCVEEGSLQGTPTMAPEENNEGSDSGKVEEATTEESNEDYAEAETDDAEANAAFLAKNPEATNDFTANGVRDAKKHIDSEKTLQVMRRVEADGDTRSTALDAIKSRIKKVSGNDEETDEETETEADDDPVESEDGEMSLEKVAALYDFSEIERDAVEYRIENGATPEEAAKAVSEL